MSDFIKKPCQHCPYRRDVKPFLTSERAEELAYLAQNPYNTFHCHKTIEHNDDGDGYAVEGSKICAGFLTLQHNENGSTFYDSDGFEPSELVYDDASEMVYAYYEEEEETEIEN